MSTEYSKIDQTLYEKCIEKVSEYYLSSGNLAVFGEEITKANNLLQEFIKNRNKFYIIHSTLCRSKNCLDVYFIFIDNFGNMHKFETGGGNLTITGYNLSNFNFSKVLSNHQIDYIKSKINKFSIVPLKNGKYNIMTNYKGKDIIQDCWGEKYLHNVFKSIKESFTYGDENILNSKPVSNEKIIN